MSEYEIVEVDLETTSHVKVKRGDETLFVAVCGLDCSAAHGRCAAYISGMEAERNRADGVRKTRNRRHVLELKRDLNYAWEDEKGRFDEDDF